MSSSGCWYSFDSSLTAASLHPPAAVNTASLAASLHPPVAANTASLAASLNPPVAVGTASLAKGSWPPDESNLRAATTPNQMAADQSETILPAICVICHVTIHPVLRCYCVAMFYIHDAFNIGGHSMGALGIALFASAICLLKMLVVVMMMQRSCSLQDHSEIS
jgi:hypothetical protein